MVIDADDPNRRSAGSFFVNPVVTTREADAAEAIAAPVEPMPRFPAGPDLVKLSAAWLIERAGFKRGHSDGRVGLSTNHALAVVNRGGATAAEIVAFASRIRARVRERFGVWLTPEPVLLGFRAEDVRGLWGDVDIEQ
jgi:UDP-N-acetylmuramate dehydrogenase